VFTVFDVFCKFTRLSQSVSRSDEQTLFPITTMNTEDASVWKK